MLPKAEGLSLGEHPNDAPTMDAMELMIDVEQSATGRLTGTVRTRDGTVAVAFSGTMELLAAVERYCLAGDPVPEPPNTL